MSDQQMEQKAPRVPVLFGQYELTIDDKNRLLVPSEIRRALADERDGAFFLVVGVNRKLWFYPQGYYEALVSQAPAEMVPAEELLAYDQLHFAMASRVEWDKQGRLVVPEKLLRRTETMKEVTLIGARDHLELWNRPEWEARQEELFARSADIANRAKQVRRES